jgi:hypothetical protein
MSETHKYIERSDQMFCDFCLRPNPKWEWSLGEGRASLAAIALGESAQVTETGTTEDADGLWAACGACDRLIQAARSNAARLPGLVAHVLRRSEDGPSEAFRRVKKSFLTGLYARIVPAFVGRRAIEPGEQPTGTLVAEGDKRYVDMVRAHRNALHERTIAAEPEDPDDED